MIRNDKVLLRGLEMDDLPVLHRWMNDMDILRNIMRIRPSLKHATEQWYTQVVKDPQQIIFAVQDITTGTFIGCIGCRNVDFIDRKAEFYIYIGESCFWGKGYAKAAMQLFIPYLFDYCNLNKIYLHVRSDHKRAIELYKKIGFSVEGIFRQEKFIEGQYIDIIRMGLLRDEWDE